MRIRLEKSAKNDEMMETMCLLCGEEMTTEEAIPATMLSADDGDFHDYYVCSDCHERISDTIKEWFLDNHDVISLGECERCGSNDVEYMVDGNVLCIDCYWDIQNDYISENFSDAVNEEYDPEIKERIDRKMGWASVDDESDSND